MFDYTNIQSWLMSSEIYKKKQSKTLHSPILGYGTEWNCGQNKTK